MRLKNNSGIIIITVLWILVILSLLSLGLGRKTSIELSLTKFAIGKVRSKYLAYAGLIYAMDQIRQDTEDPESNKTDTPYACGFKLSQEKTPEDLFKGIKLGEGHFDISFKYQDDLGNTNIHYGFQDEDGKININTLDASNDRVLKYLIMQSGYDEEYAAEWARKLLTSQFGEDNQYTRLGRDFSSVEEISTVEGIDPDLARKIQDHITVYDRQAQFYVNSETADRVVLTALARSFSGDQTNTNMGDADSLVEKILEFRNGTDGVPFTKDDRPLDETEIVLNANEKAIFLTMKNMTTQRSRLIKVNIEGVDDVYHVTTHLSAVVNRDDLSVVHWTRK